MVIQITFFQNILIYFVISEDPQSLLLRRTFENGHESAFRRDFSYNWRRCSGLLDLDVRFYFVFDRLGSNALHTIVRYLTTSTVCISFAKKMTRDFQLCDIQYTFCFDYPYRSLDATARPARIIRTKQISFKLQPQNPVQSTVRNDTILPRFY